MAPCSSLAPLCSPTRRQASTRIALSWNDRPTFLVVFPLRCSGSRQSGMHANFISQIFFVRMPLIGAWRSRRPTSDCALPRVCLQTQYKYAILITFTKPSLILYCIWHFYYLKFTRYWYYIQPRATPRSHWDFSRKSTRWRLRKLQTDVSGVFPGASSNSLITSGEETEKYLVHVFGADFDDEAQSRPFFLRQRGFILSSLLLAHSFSESFQRKSEMRLMRANSQMWVKIEWQQIDGRLACSIKSNFQRPCEKDWNHSICTALPLTTLSFSQNRQDAHDNSDRRPFSWSSHRLRDGIQSITRLRTSWITPRPRTWVLLYASGKILSKMWYSQTTKPIDANLVKEAENWVILLLLLVTNVSFRNNDRRASIPK